jgi:hypothetical protein
MLVPDNETFRSNTQGTYNIIEAACKLRIRNIILASSVTAYGVSFAKGDTNFPSFPIHEDLDVNPTDTYAIAKLCNEQLRVALPRVSGLVSTVCALAVLSSLMSTMLRSFTAMCMSPTCGSCMDGRMLMPRVRAACVRLCWRLLVWDSKFSMRLMSILPI